MRGLAHFTVRRDREGDAPAEPLSDRPHVSPRHGSAGASPSRPPHPSHCLPPTAHRPPPTAHRPPPCPDPHSAFRIPHSALPRLLPPPLPSAQPVTRNHLPSRLPPLCILCPPKPPRNTSHQPPIFPGSDADFQNLPNVQNKPRFVVQFHRKTPSFPASDSKLATRNSPPYALLNAIAPTGAQPKIADLPRRHEKHGDDLNPNPGSTPCPPCLRGESHSDRLNLPCHWTTPRPAATLPNPGTAPGASRSSSWQRSPPPCSCLCPAAWRRRGSAVWRTWRTRRCSPSWLGLRRLSGGRTVLAAVIALALAAVVEPLQSYVGRSESLDDFIHGACGIAAFVGWTLAGKLSTPWRRGAARVACVAVGAALPLADAWPTLADGFASWREFPVLADFSSPWEDRRWSVQDCRLSCEPGPRAEGDGVLRCDPSGPSQPSIILFPIRRDWSPFSSLQVEFTVQGGPLPVTLSVRDGRHVTPPKRRFDQREVYQDGRHRVGVNLHEVARGSGEVAPIDVGAVQSFHLIIEADGVGRVVRLHRIWLE